MMANASEYWAEGSQAWFEATVRDGELHDCGAAAVLLRLGRSVAAASLCCLHPHLALYMWAVLGCGGVLAV